MTAFLLNLAHNTWDMVAEMAPYLLFGFAVAGILHVLIRPERVRRLLGKPGIGGVIKGSLVGVPMPLCSCSVIPVAASLRKSGASRGATASFLSSTPQTGVDSILATYALLGGVFTLVRVGVAFVCGIVTGFFVDLFSKEKEEANSPSLPNAAKLTPLTPTSAPSPALAGIQLTPMAPPPESEPKACCSHSSPGTQERSLGTALRYGFITLPSDLARSLTIGLLLAGLITTLLPENLISGSFSSGPLAFFLATAISMPLYVCATASIPMAYALMAAGLSPGAALVFLITGPATNTATIATTWTMLGRTATFVYLASLLVISWIAGALFNAILDTALVDGGAHHHEALHPATWQHLAGIGLIALMVFSFLSTRAPKPKGTQATKACCCG